MIAKVKTVRTDRGFFFVSSASHGDILVHASALPPGQRNLEHIDIGMEIEVDDIQRSEKGYRANFAKLPSSPEHVVQAPGTVNLLGRISRLREDRGFGYIRTEPSGEYFFHASATTGARGFNALRVGDEVYFDVEQSDRGPRATNVQFVVADEHAA